MGQKPPRDPSAGMGVSASKANLVPETPREGANSRARKERMPVRESRQGKVSANGPGGIPKPVSNEQQKVQKRNSTNISSNGGVTDSFVRQNTDKPGAIHNMELTDEAYVEDDSDMDDNAALHESGFFQKVEFNLDTETGEKGAEPESNKNLDAELEAIESKKNKCLEVMRNSTEVRELIQDKELNWQDISLNRMVDMLYADRFFLTRKYHLHLTNIVLGHQLITKPSTAKVEKFMAQQIKTKLTEMQREK